MHSRIPKSLLIRALSTFGIFSHKESSEQKFIIRNEQTKGIDIAITTSAQYKF